LLELLLESLNESYDFYVSGLKRWDLVVELYIYSGLMKTMIRFFIIYSSLKTCSLN